MLITLPLMLFIVMAELSVGAFAVLFLLDWRNMVKRNFLVTYAIIYVLFTGLTVLFQLNFSNQELLDTFTLLDKSWTAYLTPFLLLFLVLMVPYTILLMMDKKAGVDGKFKQEEEEIGKTRWSNMTYCASHRGKPGRFSGSCGIVRVGDDFSTISCRWSSGSICGW